MNAPCEFAIESHWWKGNIDIIGNGLVPSGNKPLPESMLTQIYDAISRHLAAMGQIMSHLDIFVIGLWREPV